MPFRTLALAFLTALLAGLAACSFEKAENSAQARHDLDQVCRAQKSYLETRKLMKSVSERDLAREREAHFNGDVKSSLIQGALEEARRAPAGKRRKPLDLAATQAGVQGWACPELDLL